MSTYLSGSDEFLQDVFIRDLREGTAKLVSRGTSGGGPSRLFLSPPSLPRGRLTPVSRQTAFVVALSLLAGNGLLASVAAWVLLWRVRKARRQAEARTLEEA